MGKFISNSENFRVNTSNLGTYLYSEKPYRIWIILYLRRSITSRLIIMSSEEGVISKEASVIREARAVAMAKVLRGTLALNNALKQDSEGNFILEQINHSKVFLAHSQLYSSYQTYKEIHANYIIHAYLDDDKISNDPSDLAANGFLIIEKSYIRSAKKKYTKYRQLLEAAKAKEGIETKSYPDSNHPEEDANDKDSNVLQSRTCEKGRYKPTLEDSKMSKILARVATLRIAEDETIEQEKASKIDEITSPDKKLLICQVKVTFTNDDMTTRIKNVSYFSDDRRSDEDDTKQKKTDTSTMQRGDFITNKMMPLLKKKAKSEDKTTATHKSSEESANGVFGNVSKPKESSVKLCIGRSHPLIFLDPVKLLEKSLWAQQLIK